MFICRSTKLLPRACRCHPSLSSVSPHPPARSSTARSRDDAHVLPVPRDARRSRRRDDARRLTVCSYDDDAPASRVQVVVVVVHVGCRRRRRRRHRGDRATRARASRRHRARGRDGALAFAVVSRALSPSSPWGAASPRRPRVASVRASRAPDDPPSSSSSSASASSLPRRRCRRSSRPPPTRSRRRASRRASPSA